MTEFFSGSAYWALLLTVAAYQFGIWLNRKTKSALFHPIVVATVIIIPVLLVTGIPNEVYQEGMKSSSWLLTPCTVCLGISLYTQLNKLKNHLGAILAGVTAGTASSLLLIWGLCALFGLDHDITVSLLPKSVTTAMAQPLAEGAGGIGALATAAVVVTGIMGSILGPALCKLFRLKNEIARGVALGTASHVVGTTKAAEMSELTGAVSSLSLVVAGILTAIVFSFLT